MATLQFVCQLTKVNRLDYFLAIPLAIFLYIVTAGQAFSDGGHGAPPIAESSPQVEVPNCSPRHKALEVIRKSGESLVATGIGANGSLFEFWADAQDGSWTIAISPLPTISCIPAHGDGWRNIPPPLEDERS